jgi:hypothetical protein
MLGQLGAAQWKTHLAAKLTHKMGLANVLC